MILWRSTRTPIARAADLVVADHLRVDAEAGVDEQHMGDEGGQQQDDDRRRHAERAPLAEIDHSGGRP